MNRLSKIWAAGQTSMPQPRFFFNSCGIWESIPPAAAISQTVIEKKLLLVKAPQRRPENLTAAMCFFSFPEAAVNRLTVKSPKTLTVDR